MIPLSYLIAIIITALLLMSCLSNIPNKYASIIVNAILSYGTATSWMYCIIDELFQGGNILSSFALKIIIVLLLGLLFGFLLMTITWTEPTVENKSDIKHINYTTETLIGMSGKIVSKYDEESYLGYLLDGANTDIVVYPNNCKLNIGDTFIIDKIDSGCIFVSKK